MITMNNEASPRSVFEDWNVRIDGVRLLRTPVFSNAVNCYVACRNNHNELDRVVHEVAAEMCEDIRRGLMLNDPIEALELVDTLGKLIRAAKVERDRIIDRKQSATLDSLVNRT